MAPGACHCLSTHPEPQGLAGELYRSSRAAAGWAVQCLSRMVPGEWIGNVPWHRAAELVERNPSAFLAAAARLQVSAPPAGDLLHAIAEAMDQAAFPQVIHWRPRDRSRITLVPPQHWLLIEDDAPFRATLTIGGENGPQHSESICIRGIHLAAFAPPLESADAKVLMERYAQDSAHVEGEFRFLAAAPRIPTRLRSVRPTRGVAPSVRKFSPSDLVLLTNGRGGMARLLVDFGNIQSKYDCLLGANLNASIPVDRHIFAKRARVWVNANGFISALDWHNLVQFDPEPPARWRFVANAGDNHTVEIEIEADMLDQANSTVLRFTRPDTPPLFGTDLPPRCEVRLTVRVDIEDRNFHHETKRNSGADHHFSSHSRPLRNSVGFEFTPSSDRQLRVYATAGHYHHEAEWCENVTHPIEESRGQVPNADAYSPGWFDLPLAKGEAISLVLSADAKPPTDAQVRNFDAARTRAVRQQLRTAQIAEDDAFGQVLVRAVHQFAVRRGHGTTIIAGYPWFLDWGRDSLICARGLLAAGMHQQVRELLMTFGHFEQQGMLPNSIHGDDASNCDTSDAPLWYGVVCQEAAAQLGNPIYNLTVDSTGRTVAAVLRSIADGYIRGTPNGILMDPESALVWSPKHFSWMDTNFPAGTPRAGYPIEIQVLWVQLLQQLANLDPATTRWRELADRAIASIEQYFWLEDHGYLADLLIADSYQRAAAAVVDQALRSNCLFAISFGLLRRERARRCVDAALRFLVVPGALRTLAPLPVTPPLAIYGNDGRLLNNPHEPYWGRYEGDEDTRRKPAYHNGTAWTWTFPTFCEALARAWDLQPAAVAAAKAYLASMDRFLFEGCLGHLPEIVDGDAPHRQRGCDAQAWGATEALRVWRWLNQLS